MRIREVVKETGVSRELIHHYLRQGLLPQPTQRAIYTDQQIDLLRLLKKLREDHHLPLDLIRRVFETFDFDPVHLVPFTLADSLNKRMGHLVDGGDILSASLSAEELVSRAGISADRLRDYVRAKLVQPIPNAEQEMFSIYDINIIALCEQGVELGMSFDSFRTIGAYVRVGFELEHEVLFEVAREQAKDKKRVLGEIFVRREVITSFIRNLLQSLISQRLMDFASLGKSFNGSADSIVYRPSPLFCQRFGLDQAIEAAQESLCASPETPGLWLDTATLMLHAGRYREANFFLEQALEQWPADDDLLALQGKSLVLSGLRERGIKALQERLNMAGPEPLSRIYLALALFAQTGADEEKTDEEKTDEEKTDKKKTDKEEIEEHSSHVVTQANSARLIEEGLASIKGAPPEIRTETCMLAGWALTSMPPPFRNEEQGLHLLADTLKKLQKGALGKNRLPGMRERYLINTAYLLHHCAHQTEDSGKNQTRTRTIPQSKDLRALICSLDPGSAFAERVFLADQ